MTTVRKGRRRVASTALDSDASANASSFMATWVGVEPSRRALSETQKLPRPRPK